MKDPYKKKLTKAEKKQVKAFERRLQKQSKAAHKRKARNKRKEAARQLKKTLTKNRDMRKTPAYALMRRAALSRAGGRCEYCGATNRDLVVHHIEQMQHRPDLALEIKNVVAICAVCHAEIHPWLRDAV